MVKKCIWLIISLTFLITNSCAIVSIGYTKKNIEKIAERGEPIIAAIEAFKTDHGEYPETIEDLVPKYLSTIPGSGVKPIEFFAPIPIPQSGDEEPFRYLKFKEQDPLKDPVQNGFRLLVIVDPMSFMDDENMWKCLLYRSSKKYPEHPELRLEIPEERIGDWSVVVRANGSLFESEEDHYDHFLSY